MEIKHIFLKIIIIFSLGGMISCQISGRYIYTGYNSLDGRIEDEIILYPTERFVRIYKTQSGKYDSITGRWKKKKNFIYVSYDDSVIYKNLSQSPAIFTIKDTLNPSMDSLRIFIKYHSDNIPLNISLFTIKTDGYQCSIRTISRGLAVGACPASYKNRKMILEINLSPFYLECDLPSNINKSNIIQFKIPLDSLMKDPYERFLHLDPPKYFLINKNKLCIIKDGHKEHLCLKRVKDKSF